MINYHNKSEDETGQMVLTVMVLLMMSFVIFTLHPMPVVSLAKDEIGEVCSKHGENEIWI
jgi:hypothetical protein